MDALKSAIANRNRRIGNTKVKTGCVTCKVRRVKCDEEVPSCLRCTKTGRQCGGYVAVVARRAATKKGVGTKQGARSNGAVMINPITPIHGVATVQEVRALEYFIRKTAPALGDFFDVYFWTVQVPQLSQNDPALRSALIAVASVHEQMETIGNILIGRTRADKDAVEAKRLFGFNQYNSAVGRIAAQICSGTRPVEATLACCILFICFDFLRGNFSTALLHLRSSLQIAKALQEDSSTTSMRSVFKENIFRTFEHLSFQLTATHKPSLDSKLEFPSWEIEQSDDREFLDLSSANRSLDSLSRVIFTFAMKRGQLHQPSLPSEIIADLEEERIRLLNALLLWDHKFQAILAGHMTKMDERKQLGVDRLRILYLVSLILIEAGLSGTQLGFDLHMDKFEDILTLAETIVTKIVDGVFDQQCGSRYFSLDMRILPALYFVAIRCRHFSTRQRALLMLKRVAPRREGMWNSQILAAIAAQVIRLESEGYGPDGQTQVGEISFPVEENRIIDVVGGTVRHGLSTVHVEKTEVELSIIPLGIRQQVAGFIRRRGDKLEIEYCNLVW
ncbi:hypothetical protein BP6252_13718 [Coleophoma cylindrospora]|uniref:Zn(2)-C6 fungal-type domain-containing protein n=1 Tax=Coleophoma cylindrospora TaxID=1849047 RepID=A0A3D8Q728_9HELO|nr:hypothetical protein BP6252_13718 [Coleophoma cylindrospora]